MKFGRGDRREKEYEGGRKSRVSREKKAALYKIDALEELKTHQEDCFFNLHSVGDFLYPLDSYPFRLP